jgi:hypothetical protein
MTNVGHSRLFQRAVRGILVAQVAANNLTANSLPPALKRWRILYLLVVGELAALVLLFYALTRWAA